MRFVFFTDLHGNQYTWRAFQQRVFSLQADLLIFGGDVFGYYYGQKEILDRMRKIPQLICLMGNHDHMFLRSMSDCALREKLIHQYGHSYENVEEKIGVDNINFVKSWPSAASFTWQDKKYGFFHASPSDPMNGRIYPDTALEPLSDYLPYDYIFVGHTHHKMQRYAGKTQVINPGSLGQQRDGKGCSFALMDTETGCVQIETVSYSIHELEEEIDINEKDEMVNVRLKEVLRRKTQ